MKKLFFLVLIFTLSIITACTQDNADQKDKTVLTISAAASLKESLEEVGKQFMNQNADIQVHYNFGGSGLLQQQIIQGAPVDLYFSAAEDTFDVLLSKQIIKKEMSCNLLRNEIVMISPISKKRLDSLHDLTDPAIQRIAIGIPEAVPAGQYAKQVLMQNGLWDQLNKKIIPAKDVRQVLHYVETLNADAGIVYKTDAISSKKVHMYENDEFKKHVPILYPVGIISTTKHPKEAQSFFHFLQTKTSIDIFEKYGFASIEGNE